VQYPLPLSVSISTMYLNTINVLNLLYFTWSSKKTKETTVDKAEQRYLNTHVSRGPGWLNELDSWIT